MSINSHVKRLIALGLAAGAIAAASDSGAQAVAAGPAALAANASSGELGDPNAVPPILPPVQASELAAIRRAEAQERQAFNYRLPATARYSGAELDVFAQEGYSRC